MLTEKMEKALNVQVNLEAQASDSYLAMASWCDHHGFTGSAKFFYEQAEEERGHMLKLFHYTNDAGGYAKLTATKAPATTFKSLHEVFELALAHEQGVTKAIYQLVDTAMSIKDYSTVNFLQWYVAEQHEEEKLFKDILARFQVAGKDVGVNYFIDRDVSALRVK